MNSDFELLNCVADRGTFWPALLIGRVIFLAALISVAKLFTIAYTRGTIMFLLSTSMICRFILTKILCTRVLHNYILCIFNCGKWLQYQWW